MTYDEQDTQLEELLRSSLREEADAITPAGDGLARIRARVDSRRSRAGWFRPVAIGTSAAAVAAAGLGAYALVHSNNTQTISPQPADHATPISTASPTTSAKPAPAFPVAGFFPFASADAEKNWEATGGPTSNPTYLKADDLALTFASSFLQQPSLSHVVTVKSENGLDLVTLGRDFNDGSNTNVKSVTTVRLEKYGKAWIVVGADDAQGNLSIQTPLRGAQVGSPLIVSGPAYGVDEAITVDLRSLSGTISTRAAHASFGNGSGNWSVNLSFRTPVDKAGAVVAYEASAADGGPGRIAVTAVQFGNTAAAFPHYFFGSKNQRITEFASSTGAAIRYLTQTHLGGGDGHPELVGNQVFYITGAGACGNAVMSVPTAGGQPTVVKLSEPGYPIMGFAVTPDQSKLAVVEQTCNPTGTPPQGRLVSYVLGSGTKHVVQFPSYPPMPIADPTWERDGQHVDLIVQNGTQRSVNRYDAFGAQSANDSSSACQGFDASGSQPDAVSIDGSGVLWIEANNGAATQVLACTSGTPHVMFTVDGMNDPSSLSVSPDGTAVLVADTQGHVWRWSSGGQPVQLQPSVPLHAVSW
jgi:hypothetical protein